MGYLPDLTIQSRQWAEYMQQLTRVGGLYLLAAQAQAEIMALQYARMAASTMTHGAALASEVTVIFAAPPVIAQIGVFVALGAGYYEARKAAREEETAVGFSQGFILGLLRWPWNEVVQQFRRKLIHKNNFDPAMEGIRVSAYNKGLLAGYLAALAIPLPEARALRKYIKSLSRASTAGWHAQSDHWQEVARAELVQRIYVEDMARAARIHRILVPE